MTTLGPIGVKAFEARGISEETAARFGIYTARADVDELGNRTGEVEPDINGNIVAFPYHESGRIVAEKYRAPWKKFFQRKNGKKTFWNVDILDDPALEQGLYPLIIFEGEIDALTAIDCGFPFSVSVPDGAPPVPKNKEPTELEPIDPNTENTGKFEYVWANRDRIKRIKRFVLAVDNDGPGKRLEAELLRRLGASCCLSVTYPDGCKDLSDVRVKHGAGAVAECLNSARPYPVRGLYRLSDYPDAADPIVYFTGFSPLNDYLMLWFGELMIVTGIPGHGKTSWIVNLCVKLCEQYGWTVAMASFEMQTVPQLRHKLRLTRTGTAAHEWSREFVGEADKWINEHFLFIDNDPHGDIEEDLTLEWILERARDAVIRDGIRVLVIDPWNEVEHARPRGENETEYHNRALRMLRRFGTRYQVIVIIAAHPTKEVGKDGMTRMPGLYDISGSSAWYNKPDHGVVVFVPDEETSETVIAIKKVRFAWSGKKGEITMRYDRPTESYFPIAGLTPQWKSRKALREAGE